MIIVLFLEKETPEPTLNALKEKVQNSGLVKDFQYTDAALAREKFLNSFPELRGVLDNLETNPFPPSIEATLEKQAMNTDTVASFIADLKNSDGVEDVQFNLEWVEKIQSFGRLARAIGFFLGGILSLASFFIISNVIKLNVMARQNEIVILRSVGATNTYIRIPFLLEGMILGMLGSGLSLLLLFLLIQLFPVYLGQALGALNELINFRYLSLGQCMWLTCGGAAIGALGSFSSLSQFLKT
ncbi:MAG: hypothetical protein JXB26_20400 [Candidatus Aminicenantes bacterium]|nr:hypothetical protein [Candidatus Aminicenantes bacterium]